MTTWPSKYIFARPQPQKGKCGQWRFNAALANEKAYSSLLKALWQQLCLERESSKTAGEFWNKTKRLFQEFTTAYASQRQRRFRAEETRIHRALRQLGNTPDTEASRSQNDELRNQLATHTNRKAEALRIRSRIMWTDAGEKSSAYFHRRIAGRRAVNAMTALKKPDGANTEDPSKMAILTNRFYTELYSAGPTSSAGQEELLGHIENTLLPEHRTLLDRPITEEEEERSAKHRETNRLAPMD
ncbi:uncharacterized protein VTP21DRAFT_8965 [Calcarisporiella thermophila]|uniref:uncharacterized protein n=1 Tax=Calcarisporiella thermophila TaxID=911321 RepID=UPI0037421A15